MKKYVIGVIVVVGFLIVGLLALNPRLPFKTIERAESAGTGDYWISTEPGLQVLVNDYDVATAYLPVSGNALEQLTAVDFDDTIVIVVYAGRQELGYADIEIKRIVRRDNQVEIYANMGDKLSDSAVSSPYHIITVKKRGNWDQTFDFILYLDEEQSIVVSKQVS